jgi:hypothetical protein
MPLLDDPKHWRTRAKQARAIAAEMKDPDNQRTMLDIAAHYDVLAERAERRSKSKPEG